MKKHLLKLWILLLFVAVLFSLTMTAQAETSGTCGDNLTWVLDDEGNLTISGTGAMTAYSHKTPSPWGTAVNSVTIQDGVTNIGNHAFYGCSSLTSITISDSVTSIGEFVFCNCSALTKIKMSSNTTSIGKYAFYACQSLSNITLPNSLKSIGKWAFYACNRLKDINIPANVKAVDTYAFGGCFNLEDIYATNLEKWMNMDLEGIIFSRPVDLYFDSKLGTQITLPKGTTSIEDYTFSFCSNIENITVPDSVTEIGDYALWACSKLTSINIPDRVTRIGNSAFNGCSSLTSITLPDGLTHIGSSVFSGCSKLTSINIPDRVTRIGSAAFSGCSSLTSINIPDSVTSLGSSTFSGCNRLTSVVLPGGTTIIGNSVFSACYSVSKILITGDQRPNYTLPYPLSRATVYCYEFSEVDFWAIENGYRVVYLDKDDPSVGLSIRLSGPMTLWAGESTTIIADVFPPIDHDKLVWENSNEAVAVVKDGVVTALSAGSTIIRLRCGEVTGSYWLTVQVKPTAFTLSEEEIWLVSKVKHQLTVATIVPEDAVRDFTWSSSDTTVLSVDNAGKITTLNPGEAVITVSCGDISRTCKVHVCNPVTKIVLTPDKTIMTVSSTTQLTAHVSTGDQTFTNKLVTFSSSNESVAIVDQNGIVTAVAEGTATITAKSANGISASCTIKVQRLGDANNDGKIDAADALIILQYSAGWNVTLNAAKADVTGDGIIGASDALKILQDCMGGDIVQAMRALQRMLADLGLSSLEITLQPADQHVTAGETATFTVAATGDGLKYQWYIDRNDGNGWQKLNGATDAIYVTSTVQADNDGYQYRCAITDAHGAEATTDIAILHVVLDMPNTGDASMPALWLAMCMLSMIGMMILKRRTAVE